MAKFETYECNYCHHYFGFQKPKINSLCPGCGHPISGFITLPAESWKPGIGCAILVFILAFFIPIIPGLAALLIARNTDSKATRIICWVGMVISIAELTLIIVAIYTSMK